VILSVPAVGRAAPLDDNPHGWTGRTEQRLEITMFITRSKPRTIQLLDPELHWTCDDGREGETGFSFGGYRIPIVGGYATFRFNDFRGTFHFSGHFGSGQARGVVGWSNAACTSGAVAWEARQRIR
jgi:hypothetical protein